MGRLTRDPEVRYTQGESGNNAIARYTLAVDRRFSRDRENNTDFINCVAFGRTGEFAEKYFRVINLDKGLHVIKLYDVQKEFLRFLVDNNKVICVSGR